MQEAKPCVEDDDGTPAQELPDQERTSEVQRQANSVADGYVHLQLSHPLLQRARMRGDLDAPHVRRKIDEIVDSIHQHGYQPGWQGDEPITIDTDVDGEPRVTNGNKRLRALQQVGWNEPVPIRRRAAVKRNFYHYHVAPTSARQSIAEHGLQLGDGGRIWLWNDEGAARDYHQHLVSTGRDFDLYRADVTGYRTAADPHLKGQEDSSLRRIVRRPVPPERLELVTTPPPGENGLHERHAGKGKPRHDSPDVARRAEPSAVDPEPELGQEARGDVDPPVAPDPPGRPRFSLIEHPAVLDDVEHLPPKVQDTYFDRVDALERGDRHSSTHALHGPLVGWAGTSIGGTRYRIIHRFNGDELHVLSAGVHDEAYDDAKRRKRHFAAQSRLSDESRVSVAEHIMEQNGHSGRSFDVPNNGRMSVQNGTEYDWDDDRKHPAAHYVHDALIRDGHDPERARRFRVYPDHWNLDETHGQAITDGLNYVGTRDTTNELALLHECAHIRTRTPEGPSGHGQAFQETAHRLYHRHLGPEAADVFRGLLEASGSQKLGWRRHFAALEEDDDYRMQHRPPGRDGVPIHDLTQNFPADIYTHPHYYSDMSEPSNQVAHSVIRRVRGKPDARVHIYRALPAEHAHQGIRPGDWVTTSKDYARQHGQHSVDPKHDWPVIHTVVRADDLHTDGDDWREFGYNGAETRPGNVAFKGGYHQEVRQHADGVIRPVVRRQPKQAELVHPDQGKTADEWDFNEEHSPREFGYHCGDECWERETARMWKTDPEEYARVAIPGVDWASVPVGTHPIPKPLHAKQDFVNSLTLDHYRQGGDIDTRERAGHPNQHYPAIFKWRGKHWADVGTHRLAAAMERGDTHYTGRYVDLDAEGQQKQASTYTVRLEHGRRRSPHQYTVPDDGPVTPAYLEHPVDVSYVHISVPAYDEDGNHRGDLTMENEARNTAVRMHHDRPGVPTDMVTKADVIKVEAAQATGPFFHGTAAELKPGDLIEPNRFPPTRPDPDIRGDKAEDPREHTYFTSRKQYVVEHYGPNVYEVEPTGEYKHDSEYRHPEMFKSPHPLRVVRQVTRDWGTPHTAALDPREAHNLDELRRDGYCTEGWNEWHQGHCGTYATGLMRIRPSLRLGVSGQTELGGGDASEGWRPNHYFAHDDAHAYDAAGEHSLPYRGVHNEDDYHELNHDPEDWGVFSDEGADEDVLHRAMDHARRNGILEGRYGPHQRHQAALDLHQVRVLNPTTGHDPDLFDGEELKPEIRRDLIHRWTVFCAQHGLANWHAYTELYFTGGEASNWSGPGSSPNGDFDMQVGLDFDEFRAVNVEWKPLSDAEVSAKLNDLFWTGLDDHDYHPAGSPRVFDLTWFSNPAVNPDISAIRPYAAWNVLREEWAVHPKHYVQAPHLPAGVRKALQGADRYARQVLALPEPQRTREAAALFESWHTDRSAAFGPGGAGVFDYANLRMKALEATGVWQQLQDAANWLAGKTAAVKPLHTAMAHPAGEDSGVPPYPNPTGADSWYHGTSTEFEGAPDPDSKRSDTKRRRKPLVGNGNGIAHRFWNTDLGTHFTSLHEIAGKFARSAPGKWTPRHAPYEHSRIAHVDLHMTNPKSYGSEHDLVIHGVQWAHDNGYRFDAEHHPDHVPEANPIKSLNEIDRRGIDGYRGEPWVQQMSPRGHQLYFSSIGHDWLQHHPQRQEISRGFVDHLRDQGHDGILYGNEYEAPRGHTSAIAFPETPVTTKRWEYLHPDRQASLAPRAATAKVWFHGTSMEDAQDILDNGARAGLNLITRQSNANDYARTRAKWHSPSGRGVVLEGVLDGDEEEHPWERDSQGRARRGIAVTSRPGAFTPTHWHEVLTWDTGEEPATVRHPISEALAPRTATALGERLWGAGDPDALFNGNPVASTPFAPAGRSVKRQDYDKERVRDALLHPEKYPTQPVDPRNLRSTQPMVTRAGVQHYMRNPGSLYADQHNAGNVRPMVYRREDGQDLLLSGHHRGVSSLLKAEPLHAVVVEGPWGGPRVAPRKPQAARYHSAMPTAIEYPPIYRHQLSTSDARRSREVSPEEFQETARRGHEQYERLRQGGSPPHGLDQNWDHVVRHAYQATREPWGGATYNAHTGEPVESDADAYALTVRHPGMPRVEVPPDASEEEFSVAMHHARNAYHDALHYRGAHLGVFHDAEKGSVDIDPVTIVHSLKDAEELGAYTHATGGAYHFKSGEGFWPPHVRES